jgi:hypothetical protein
MSSQQTSRPTVAERRLLNALRLSVEVHGHPSFATPGNSSRGRRYVITGYRHVEGAGRINETLIFRQETLASLREKGLVDASLCPVAPAETGERP